MFTWFIAKKIFTSVIFNGSIRSALKIYVSHTFDETTSIDSFFC